MAHPNKDPEVRAARALPNAINSDNLLSAEPILLNRFLAQNPSSIAALK